VKAEVVVNYRRKTKSAAAQLVLQAAYATKLPAGEKKKPIFSTYLEKNHIPKFYATLYESLFQ